MKPLPGTYVLVLRSKQHNSIAVGRWGSLAVRPGYYLYVGSAFGPGGVRARVSRHCRADKSRRWHIDYLREVTTPVAIWCNYEPIHLEHHWAASLEQLTGLSPVKGFGCTDCQCQAHLFFAAKRPALADFTTSTGNTMETCSCEQSS